VFIGHFGAAFAAKRAAPGASLGWLFAACQLPDLLWPLLVFAGTERFRIDPGNTALTPIAFDHYPWSHSLVMGVVWGAAIGAAYVLWRRDTGGGLIIFALVVSHWVLDWITHRPDMPIAPGSDVKVGLGLWNSIPATVAVELLIFAVGVTLYMRATRARDRIGSIGLWTLVVLLLVISIANIASPPPPSVTAVAVTALGMWVFVGLAAWVDRHRVPGNIAPGV
jgi:membrane-bound metal-dependent hydrolase YbcI (DUF457 family)